MDRPSRKTKTVNYCEAKDFDEDEDFAAMKAPPSKKIKEDLRREHKHSSNKSLSQESNSQSSQISRKPLNEKLLNRDLEAAITLSMLNNADGEKELCHTDEETKVEVPSCENVDPSSLLRSNCSVDADHLGLDKITSENQSGKQKKTESKKKKDEDYEPKLTPDSESDEDFSEPDESDDEEFTVKKTSKAKKKMTKSEKPKTSPAANKAKRPSKAKSQGTAASAAVRSPPAVRPASSSSLSSRPSVSVSPAGGRVPKWTPPAQIGKSPTSCQLPVGRSPGRGLRLGLSRLVRVKPLHPSVTSH